MGDAEQVVEFEEFEVSEDRARTDWQKVEAALAREARRVAVIARLKREAQERISTIERWLDAQIARLDKAGAWDRQLVEGYARARLRANPKFRSEVFPHGRLTLTAPSASGRLKVVGEAWRTLTEIELDAGAPSTTAPTLVRVKPAPDPEVDANGVKEAIKVGLLGTRDRDDGPAGQRWADVVDEATGEVVDGLRMEYDTEYKFKINPGETPVPVEEPDDDDEK